MSSRPFRTTPGVVSISSRIRWITGRTGVVAGRLTGTSFADPL
jgi:hypothetical protein